MSTDSISTQTLEEFVKKVRSASRSKQNQINIPIEEAENVVWHLSLVLLKLIDKFQDAELRSANEEQVITVSMDGGGFEEKR